jgi:hypothetical protein
VTETLGKKAETARRRDGQLAAAAPAALVRNELQREITASSGTLTFTWIVRQVPLNLVDQNGMAITSLSGQPSRLSFLYGPSQLFAHGSTVALPITDNNAYPTESQGGQWCHGHHG